jgi:hypothetical protein
MNRRQEDIVVPVSGETYVSTPGGKCIDGVYIPSSQVDTSFSEFCSVCLTTRDRKSREGIN